MVEFILSIFFLLLLFIAICLWTQFGKFLILLISNEFCWKDFKEEFKEESMGFEEVIYLCWVIFVPIQLFYFIKEKLSKK